MGLPSCKEESACLAFPDSSRHLHSLTRDLTVSQGEPHSLFSLPHTQAYWSSLFFLMPHGNFLNGHFKLCGKHTYFRALSVYIQQRWRHLFFFFSDIRLTTPLCGKRWSRHTYLSQWPYVPLIRRENKGKSAFSCRGATKGTLLCYYF